jgi:hypothetical protein
MVCVQPVSICRATRQWLRCSALLAFPSGVEYAALDVAM